MWREEMHGMGGGLNSKYKPVDLRVITIQMDILVVGLQFYSNALVNYCKLYGRYGYYWSNVLSTVDSSDLPH